LTQKLWSNKNKYTSIMSKNIFFFENRTFYEIMGKNMVEWGWPQMTIWCMRFACWTPKATNTQPGYVLLIDLPL